MNMSDHKRINGGQCSGDGCEKTAQSKGLCSMHYARFYRGGTLERRQTRKQLYVHTQGYLVEHDPTHPLANGSGEVYQHRRVYYDANGDGPFACTWCGITVFWSTLHIDHLDDCKTNNELSNLAASCGPCNTSRGLHKTRATKAANRGIEYKGVIYLRSELAAMVDMTWQGFSQRLRTMSVEEAMDRPKYRELKRDKTGPATGTRTEE
jgi:5-methylcytosine-specific restriction endonuclease McrA